MAQSLRSIVCFLALCLAMSVTAGCSDDSTSSTQNNGQEDIVEDASASDVADADEPGEDAAGEDTAGEDATGEDATGEDATDEDATGEDATDEDVADDADTSDPECPAGEELCDGECVQGPCEVVCGARAGDTCADDEYCKFPDGTMCDYADGTGICTPRPAGHCPTVLAPVCGCDGQTYNNACEANMGGTDVASEGVCAGSESCDAQDARGQGQCDMVLGVFWDGGLCVTRSGCSCVGADCDAGYDSMDQCEAAHLSCPTDCRTDGCPNATDTCGLCWASFACIPEGAAC